MAPVAVKSSQDPWQDGRLSRIFAPVKISLGFSNRVCRLGEPVDFTVQLTARNRVEVREGFIDLVVEEKYTETKTRMLPDLVNSKAQLRRLPLLRILGPGPSQKVPRKVTEKQTVCTVQSSVRFMCDQRFVPGDTQEYGVRLDIAPDQPAQVGKGPITWKLISILDLA